MRTIFLLLLILITSCNSPKKENKETVDKSISTQEATEEVQKEFSVEDYVEKIKDYYHESYGEGNKLDKVETDSLVTISYSQIPENEDDYGMTLISIHIPILNKNTSTSFLHGDLNNDNFDEVIVDVFTEGGGGGGNMAWTDFFAFKYENGKYTLVDTKSGPQLNKCGGFFNPKKIENGFLIGESLCYGPDDGRCCPSLNYSTKVQLKNDELVFHSQKLID